MKFLELKIETKSPLLIIQTQQASNIAKSENYIPGSVIRGLLAGMYYKNKNKVEDFENNFKKLFFSSQVKFTNAYIEGSSVIPLSAYQCKAYHDKIRDCLFDGVPKECEGDGWCTMPLECIGGNRYYKFNENTEEYEYPTVQLDFLTHNTIEDETGRTDEATGGPFTYYAISQDQIFTSKIFYLDELQDLVTKIKNLVDEIDRFYIGKSRNANYGEIEVIIEPDKKQNDICNLRETVKILSDKKTIFTITLHSDAILYDKFLNPQVILQPELLDIGEEVEIHTDYCYQAFHVTGGFNNKHGFPKESEIAISKGSVFLYSCDENFDKIKTKLAELEKQGIGFRCNEGFGQIKVNDDYHIKNRSAND